MKKFYVVYENNSLSRPYETLSRAMKSHENWENGVSILSVEGMNVTIVDIVSAKRLELLGYVEEAAQQHLDCDGTLTRQVLRNALAATGGSSQSSGGGE